MIFRNVWGFFVRTVLVLSVCGAVVPTAQAFDKPTSLSVIVASDFSPYSFTGPNGEPIGYIKDLWDLWARRNGVAVTYRPMDWRAGREAVATGTADVVGSMQNVGADGRLTLSAQSIALIPFHAFYNADVSEIIDAGSLKNVTVGAVEEGGCYDWLQRSGIPHIRTYPSITALVDSIRLG